MRRLVGAARPPVVGDGRRGLGVFSGTSGPNLASLGSFHASLDPSMEGAGGGRAVQIYGVVAYVKVSGVVGAMARRGVAVLEAYLA